MNPTMVRQLANAQLVYQSHGDGGRLLTALNVADHPARLPAPHARTVEAGGGDLQQAGTAEASVLLAPHGWAVLAA